MRTLKVHFLPQLANPRDLSGSTCVVIDVLRATTTICYSLAAGAKEVIPCLEVDEAQRVAASLPAGSYLLGGERGGQKIAGFHLGNSPAEYTPDVVGGKTIVFTTTNGTRALMACAGAERILCGAFVNLSAICEVISPQARVNVICAGTDGHITREDVLLAGVLVERLTSSADWTCNDEAQLAQAAWKQLDNPTPAKLADTFACTRGGSNLVELEMQNDLGLAAAIDKVRVVPSLTGQQIRPLVVANP